MMHDGSAHSVWLRSESVSTQQGGGGEGSEEDISSSIYFSKLNEMFGNVEPPVAMNQPNKWY